MSPDRESKKKDAARERRRRRRRREQRLYVFILILMILLIAGGVFFAYVMLSGNNPLETFFGERTARPVAVSTQSPASGTGETVSDEELQTRAEQIVQGMTVQEKVAALFILPFDTLSGEENAQKATNITKRGLEAYTVSGIFFDSGNVQSKKQVMSMIEDIRKSAKYPILMFFEENGGTQNAMATVMEVTPPASPALIGEGGDATRAYETGKTIGGYLYAAGFDVDVAPVANIKGDENALIYGNNPQAVFDMSTSMLNGLKESGMLACAGRFPYLTEEDPGGMAGVTSSNVSLNEIRQNALLPFNGCISVGTDLIMMSSIQLPRALSANTPATLSDLLITDILRGELGFNGVVVSAPLNQKAITGGYTTDNAAVTAILAGVDLLYAPEDFETAYQGILDAVSSGMITEERINESLVRILKLTCRGK